MNFSSARLFCEVARCRSLSQAAKQLGITQPAASQRLKQLEDHLGVRLVDRSVRPLSLTAAGETYLQGAQAALQTLEQAETDARRIGANETHVKTQGLVRVSAIYSAGISFLSECADRFRELHPQAKVEMEFLTPDAVASRVNNAKAELGVVSYPDRFSGLRTEVLREEPLHLACPPSHPLANKKEIHPEELKDRTLYGFVLDLPIARHVDRYFKTNQGKPHTDMRFDNIDTLKSAILNTGKAGILPAPSFADEVEQGTLVSLPLTPPISRPIGIVYTRGNDLSPAARAFMQVLVEHNQNRPTS